MTGSLWLICNLLKLRMRRTVIFKIRESYNERLSRPDLVGKGDKCMKSSRVRLERDYS